MMKETAIRRNGNFIKFISANALANLGNWFDYVGVLILFRYSWNADPILIALIPIMYAIPSIVLGQFAGVFADQRNKRKILIYSDWARALLTLFLAFSPSLFIALPILLLRSTVGVISLPAQQGLISKIVEDKDIMKAVTINGSISQLAKVIGPLIGGSFVSIFSPEFSIILNTISFVISGLILSRLQIKDQAKKGNSGVKEQYVFLSLWKEGWSIVFNSKILLASIIFGIFSTLTIQMIDVQMVTLFSVVFPNVPEVTGWAISAIGIGSLLIVLLLNHLEKIQKYGWFFGTGGLLIGIMTGGFGYLQEYNIILLAIILAFIGGIGNGITLTTINYLVQTEPPKEAIGRISSIIDSILSILFIAGPLLGGLMIKQLGVLKAFQTIGLGLTIIGLTGILLQKLIWNRNQPATKDIIQYEQDKDVETLKEYVKDKQKKSKSATPS
ncbi:arabinose ABC transporter permease [Pradoshia eiseniae]|uniref:Arabinose ABC transporter permease n=1 Tax=Pradoshia eiseniae TaxID=2064768 RepID=A0A2S7N0Z3_9BACI|nr:MFS transporter [Pradoshia eiseniae]PQD95704.1 arabinose ABC transporter permease [Pradoshia eiseniae]